MNAPQSFNAPHADPHNAGPSPLDRARRLCVAPMMDWTTRHCRFFHRLLAPNALLYTEMVTAAAVIYGKRDRLLGFDTAEHPVALQLGGSDPRALAEAAAIGQAMGYDEINLNCGCPSDRVQKGAFGACLMREPALVADCLQAMRESVTVPVTVKHRIGVDDENDYAFLSRFVEPLYFWGCRVFIVHARAALLKGLSPKENREIPPLHYERLKALKQDFPKAQFILNGGLTDATAVQWLETLPADGLMIGRAAYHNPWLLRDLDALVFGEDAARPADRREVIEPLQSYFEKGLSEGVPATAMTRHWHGLFHGQPGAVVWRRAMAEGRAPATVTA
ncbi:MAG: tRNA dihydrouridine(20/20a) synthase DusA [Burkholderiaceae bacterium]